jgi:hypothetical protein
LIAATATPSCVSGANYLGCYGGKKVYQFTSSGSIKY